MQVESVYGSAVTWAARIGIQGTDILAFCQVEDRKKLEATEALMRLHARMVPLQKALDEVTAAVEQGFQEYTSKGNGFDWGKPLQNIPSVPDLLSRGEGFLQSAKIAIAATTDVIGVFYGKQFDHRFNRLVDWASQEFGANDDFAKNAKISESFVKEVLTFRDAIEHPASGRFFVTNIQINDHKGRWLFHNPEWGIEGNVPTDMLICMARIIEEIVQISESFVIGLFIKLKYAELPFHIEEIPVELRDPQCPVRYRAVPSFADCSIDIRS